MSPGRLVDASSAPRAGDPLALALLGFRRETRLPSPG
jgi:hypothetical protein